MNVQSIQDAVGLLIAARNSGVLLDALRAHCQPATIDEAHAIQDATVTALGDTVAGWKIAAAPDGAVMRGVLLGSRVRASPARMSASEVPLLGVEAEIAFRFERDLPPRAERYSYDEVAAAVIALPAIEVVDSRFKNYRDTPILHRLADCMSNGAFVHGAPLGGWRGYDLTRQRVKLTFERAVVAEVEGGHPARDPLLPAIALVNELRTGDGIRVGQIMTTGTYTSLHFARAGQSAVADFDGIGSVEVRFET